MIKKYFFALFLLIPFLACAQKDSSRLILRFNGGYADTGSSNWVTSLGASAYTTRDWDVGLTVGLPFGERWEAGVGFEYGRMKTVANYSIYLPKQWMAMEVAETKMNLFIGKAYVAGRWKLFSRLYFNPILSVGIGKATGTKISQAAWVQELNTDEITIITPGTQPQAWGSESDISYDYFAIGLSPAFSFYFTRHFALNLETGSFRFSTSDWKWDNKQWLANVNPAYWQLGIIVSF
jgi:hypothetical protein